MRDIFPRPGCFTSTGSNHFLIHLIIFNILMPWNIWTGKALSSKFNFRDDPSMISKVKIVAYIKALWLLTKYNQKFFFRSHRNPLSHRFKLFMIYQQRTLEHYAFLSSTVHLRFPSIPNDTMEPDTSLT